MGEDKRFLIFQGQTFLDRAVGLAEKIVESPAVLCGDVPERECIEDVYPNIGPLGGVLAAVQWFNKLKGGASFWLLLLPVDMPLLEVEALQILLSKMKEANNFNVIRFTGHEMPFLVKCNKDTEAILHELCRTTISNRRSIRAFQEKLGFVEADLNPSQYRGLTNINSPENLMTLNGGKVR
jgi:molybdopterin-guanine dinucleotide biosynthesis protein A